jgi:hypothetical protein
VQGKRERLVLKDFVGSTRAREMIRLLSVNNPRLGGHTSPKRWWGFASYGIRAGFFLQTVDREKKWKKRKWLLKDIDKV